MKAEYLYVDIKSTVTLVNAPLTSSAGRLFDAVAALAGVRRAVRYEGQAAIELEGLATEVRPDGVYPFELAGGSPLVVDTRPLIAEVAAEVARGRGAGMHQPQ